MSYALIDWYKVKGAGHEFAGRMAADVKEIIRRIVKGETPVTTDIAQRMESVLGVPASFWKKLEQQYRR